MGTYHGAHSIFADSASKVGPSRPQAARTIVPRGAYRCTDGGAQWEWAMVEKAWIGCG